MEPEADGPVEKLTNVDLFAKDSAASTGSEPPDVIAFRDKSRRSSSVRLSNATSAYDVDVSDLASNTLALFHNALRHETATYASFAAPVFATHVPVTKSDETVDELLDRWVVLGRFMVLVSRIEEVVCKTVFRDVNVGFRREALAVEKTHKAIKERLNYGYELFARATSKACRALEKNASGETLKKFKIATEAQINFATDTMGKCEQFIQSVDDLGDKPLRHPNLEREVWDTLQKVCRRENFGFTAVQLFRWSKNESYLVRWMSRHTSSKEQLMRKVQEWVKMYTERDDKKDPAVSPDPAREATKDFSASSSSSDENPDA